MTIYELLQPIVDDALAQAWRQLARGEIPERARKRLRLDDDGPVTYSDNVDWLERFIIEWGPDLPPFGFLGVMVALIVTAILLPFIVIAMLR